MGLPSLQACVRTLEELLELLSGDLEGLLEQAASLSERCHAVTLDCQALPAGCGATDAERLSLERLLSTEADVLPSLGARLHAAFAPSNLPRSRLSPLVVVFEASRALLDSCTCLCKAVSTSPTALLHHCRAAQLLHTCGAQYAAQLAADVGHASSLHLEGTLVQLHSHSHVFNFARSLQLAGQLPADPAAVSAAFPPAVVLPWLASVGKALLAGLQCDPGNVPVLLGAIQVQRKVAEFRSLHAAAGEDSPTLCPDSMLRLLRVALGNLPAVLPLLQAAAADSGDGDGEAAAAGPSGGSSGGSSSGGSSGGSSSGGSDGGSTNTFGGFAGRGDAPTWQPWELCKASLDTAHSLPCWREFLNGHQGRERSSLRQAAVNFLAALPQQQPADVPDNTFVAVHDLAAYLPLQFSGMFDGCFPFSSEHPSADVLAAAAQQAGWQPQQAPWVLQQLPAVVASLRVVAAYADHDGVQHVLAALVATWNNALIIIFESGLHQEATGAAELAALCSSAAAALRLLPTLAAVRVRCPQQTTLAGAAIALADQCLRLLFSSTRAAFVLMRQGETHSGEALARPQWELHSATCRLAHWVCTAASADERAALEDCDIPQMCYELLRVLFSMLREAKQRAEGLGGEESAVIAAHWEAMMVLLQDDLAAGRLLGRHAHDGQAGHLALFAAAAMEMFPLLATDARLAQLLKMCFAVVMDFPAGSPEAIMRGKACRVLESSLERPCVTALLVQQDVLQQLLEHRIGAAEATAGLCAALWSALRAVCDLAYRKADGPPDRAASSAAIRQLEGCRGSSKKAVLKQLRAAQPAAAIVLRFWRQPELQAAMQLQVAQAAAARSCANLRCANLGSCTGGPAAGELAGSKRCSACRVARYCGTACSHADWRASGQVVAHKHVCQALRQERDAARQARWAQQAQP